jgi:hypothetical protein
MWGPGAEQGGILQTSSCKLDLKEPYYRMSQPQVYPLAQDQQTQPLVQTQVFNLLSCLSFSCSLCKLKFKVELETKGKFGR